MENLADVHNHSFTNKWDVELYGRVFHAPWMEYEIVTVAPDGRFASFTNVWVDEVNHTILFEPVGTHSDFRQMGIGKAMMVYVLKRMQAERGIQRAYVCHELADKNPASAALYRSVGFRPKYEIHDYVKSLKTR
jgi:ribosomal protein S18 acetylase RimI-like enzyme